MDEWVGAGTGWDGMCLWLRMASLVGEDENN
jgi:hypothetical protein